MSQDLCAKYRPEALDDVVGQESAVETLKGFVDRKAIPHAILLFGPPGVGKTSIARALARGPLGCARPTELNIADLTGVDTVREIDATMRLGATFGKSRVYILDECQQMGKPAQQALLKPLEEPPRHVYFLLCTTDPDKLLQPVRSRCTKVKLTPLNQDDMAKLLKRVVRREKIKTTDDVLDKIAEYANGGARDALKYLDAVRAVKGEESQLATLTAAVEQADSIELARVLLNPRSRWADCRRVLKKLEGHTPEEVRRVVVGYVRAVALNGGMLARCRAIYNEFDQEMIQSGKAGEAQLLFACLEVVGAK